ncbi:hypothetical protein Vafri_18968 [Volvox africanus]|uniref:Uncharacterized protein n=1 Tax=Volvox africanus TaxID=51714 RepID=A0A8J4BNB5_9CHLO|nr:hypothetical protein Vafri_18968 [Volvox africanus]
MITMLLNRCNANWAEAQAWGPPSLVSQGQLNMFSRSDMGLAYRDEALRMLLCGTIAVHMRAADDYVEQGIRGGGASPGPCDGAVFGSGGAGGGGGGMGFVDGSGAAAAAIDAAGSNMPGVLYRSTAPDLWTHDPWKLLETYRPGMVVSGTFRLEGLSLGCRYIAALVMALDGLAGQEAVKRLPLILVVNEDQQDEVIHQLCSYKFFGLSRENVVVLIQPSHPGYWYNNETRTWDQGDASHNLPLGSGYGLMQLAWREEAMWIGEDGCLRNLGQSALAWMEEKGISWMISRRARDLGLLSREGVFDINALSYALYYHKERYPDINIIMEAALTNSLLLSRVLDSFILSRRLDAAATAASTSTSTSGSGLMVATRTDSIHPRHRTVSVDGSSVQHPPMPPPLPYQVVELCSTDLLTPAMRAVLADYQDMGRVLAGLGRYMMHIPSIKPLLAGRLSVLRPKLGLVDDLLHIRMELADLTSAPNAQSLLLQARSDSPQLLVQDDVEALLPLLQAQDENHYFRHLVQSSRVQEGRKRLPGALGGADGNKDDRTAPGGPERGGNPNPKAQRIVVFVISDVVSAAAVSMVAAVAQPGRDLVMLVTVVAEGPVHRQRGEETLTKHAAEFQKLCAAQYTCEIVERNTMGLIDCMIEYATRNAATLTVMGSNSLTSKATTMSFAKSASSTNLIHIVGSITVALLRRLPIPLLLITRTSIASVSAATAVSSAEKGGKRHALNLMAVLDGHAGGMVDYLAGRLCNSRIGDQIYFTYIKPSSNLTQQQVGGIKAVLGKYVHQASVHGTRPVKTLLLDGPADRALAKAVSEHQIDLLVLPAAPLAQQVSPMVIATLRSACTAVLWYRDPPESPSSLGDSDEPYEST